MIKSSKVDKLLIVILVFLLSLSGGYLPISAKIANHEDDVSPTRAAIWLSLKR